MAKGDMEMVKGEMEDGGAVVYHPEKKTPGGRGIFVRYQTLCIALAVTLITFVVVVLLVYFLHPGSMPAQPRWRDLPAPQAQQERRPFEGRLPDNLKPSNYRVTVTPYLDEEDGDRRFFFDGRVRISVNCTEATDSIILHALKLDIDEDSVTVEEIDSGNVIGVRDIGTDELYDFFIINTEERLQAGNNYHISMDYVGVLNHSDAYGFYVGTYQAGEDIRYIASTQLELTHARRVFPSFDEPSFKATFDVSVKHRVRRWALSNMPSLKNVTAGDWNTASFETSPVMSTYLVAIVVSDFVCVETITQSGLRFRVWAQEANINQTHFALDVGVDTLEYMEGLLGIDYPLTKFDMVAVPVFQFGAMENWGLVIYAQRAMLFDPDAHSPIVAMPNARIVCHEVAHMWYGNTVTMQWWSESWLNEGFATYFEYPTLHKAFPEWNVYSQFRPSLMIHRALDTDADTDSHPTIQPGVGWNNDLLEQFDSRVYERGGSVLLMMRSFLGDSAMYDAMRRYLKRHNYDVATTDDVWHEMTRSAENFGNAVNVKEVMDPWLLQFGYPVVNIKRTGVTTATAEQRHFLLDSSDSPTGYTWHIPLTYVHSGSDDLPLEKPSLTWMNKTSKSTILHLDGANTADWILANIYQHGYYLINYDADNWHKLIQQLQTDHTKLPAENRAALIYDSFSLARSGDIGAVVAFQVIDYLRAEEDFSPWKAADQKLEYVDHMLQSTPTYGYFEAFLRELIKPVYSKFGWDFRRDNMIQYRLQLEAIKLSCNYGNEDCVLKAKEIYATWMASGGETGIQWDVRRPVLCSVIKHGGYQQWQFAYDSFVNTTDTFTKHDLTSSLGCTREMWLLDKYLLDVLELYQNETGKDSVIPDFMREWEYAVDKYNIFKIIDLIRKHSSLGLRRSWKFAVDHFSALRLKNEQQAFHIIWNLAQTMNTKEELDELENFARTYNDMPPEQTNGFYKARNQIRDNIRWMERNYKDLAEWLESRFRA